MSSIATLKTRSALVAAVASLALGTPGVVKAAAYASGVTQSGSTVNFVLNESADQVNVNLGGGGTLNLGALAAGTHSFDLGSASSYEIQVTKTAPTGYTEIGSLPFYSPKGVSVNGVPSSANFGDIYISESTTGTTTASTPTARTAGFYKLRADMSEEDFGTAGLTRTGTQTYGKTTIGSDGVLYNADFSSDLAFQISDDLDSNIALINSSNKTADQWVRSIAVTGTGAARQIYLANANYADTARKGVVQYALTGPSVAANDTGTLVVDSVGVDTFFASDVEVDSAGNMYVAVNRFTAGQADAITKFSAAGTELFNIGADYTGANGMALSEQLGLFAYGSFYDGMVHVFNTTNGALVDSFDAGGALQEVAFDAAGNIYTVSSVDELLKIFSPGGSLLATTGSDGTFSISAAPIPEPTSLALLGLAGLGAMRRRRQI